MKQTMAQKIQSLKTMQIAYEEEVRALEEKMKGMTMETTEERLAQDTIFRNLLCAESIARAYQHAIAIMTDQNQI